MFSVSFSGFFCSVSPVWKSGSIAVRGKPVPLFLYGFGIISGRSLTLLFVLLLLARLPAQNLVDVALDGLKLTDTLMLFPVVVISGVFLDGQRLDFLLECFPARQLLDTMLPEISGSCFGYDKIAFVLLPVGSAGFVRFLRFQTVTGGLRADVA
mgnify:CR=1 FL=1